MKNLYKQLELFLSIILGITIFILTLPFIIITLPVNYYNRKKFEKNYAEFLLQNNNINFFCYNNRKNTKQYIETEIIPILNNDIEIVYLNGKIIENKRFPSQFLSHALYQLNNYSKFPHLMKIRNGKLIDKSINTIFYSIKSQNKSTEKLIIEINNFFKL